MLNLSEPNFMIDLARELAFPSPSLVGPLTSGHYVQIGMGMGFYVPEEDYQRVQALADETRKVQFLGVTRNGQPLTGRRDEINNHPESAGMIAWIVPQGCRLY